MLRLILESFMVAAAPVDPDAEPEFLVEKAMEKLAGESAVRLDEQKRRLLLDWVKQDLCFSTRKKKEGSDELVRFLLPHTAAVGGLKWKAGKGQEAYAKIVDALARGGRTEANLPIELGRKRFFELFTTGAGDVGADMVEDALKQGTKEKKGQFDAPPHFDDYVFCKPHARLFQDDIYLLSKWDVPRGQRVELLKRVLVFHLCAYFVRMAKLADWVVASLLNKLDSPQAYASEQLACRGCLSAYKRDHARAPDLAAACRFHPGFALGGARSQEWHEVLARYHVNVATVNLLLRVADKHSGSAAHPSDVLALLDMVSRDRLVSERVRNGCPDGAQCHHGSSPSGCLETVIGKLSPKGHAWDFFRRYASSSEAGFMSRPYRDGLFVTLSPELLSAWGHIYWMAQYLESRPAYFMHFQDFLRARGVYFSGDGLGRAESMLRSLGLLKQYADMGVARRLEPVFPPRVTSGV
jgi:hypothetical protein